MAIPFCEFFQSDLFNFFIGTEKKLIVVHSAALTAQSKVLETLINGRMREAQSRSAEIEDAEVDDFVRLCEFAYRGDYTTPAYEISEKKANDSQSAIGDSTHAGYGGLGEVDRTPYTKEEEPEEYSMLEEPLLMQDGWLQPGQDVPPLVGFENGFSKKSKKGKSWANSSPEVSKAEVSKAAKFRERFNRKSFCKDGFLRDLIIVSFKPVSNSSPNQDFTPVFLAHARLYVLADKYLMPSLKSLALHKLHETLLTFKLYPSRIGDILELARYAYSSEHTRERSELGTIDELREIAVEYIVREIQVIGGSKEFSTFIREGGPFVTDFWGLLLEYLL